MLEWWDISGCYLSLKLSQDLFKVLSGIGFRVSMETEGMEAKGMEAKGMEAKGREPFDFCST